jgi:hypothetical protein
LDDEDKKHTGMKTDLEYIIEVRDIDECIDIEKVLKIKGYTFWWSSLRKPYDELNNRFLCVFKNKEYSFYNVVEISKNETQIISDIDFYKKIAGLTGDPIRHLGLFKALLYNHDLICNSKDLQRIEDALYL